jgi:polyhydroxybutyrate depolymerase
MRQIRKIKTALFLGLAILPFCLSGGTGKAGAVQPQSASFGDHHLQLRVGDLDRQYTVHIPPRYDGKTSLPVVIMLHGGGGTGKAADIETGWSSKADQAGFIAVFPEALSPDPSRPGSFARNPQLWNDGSDRFYPGREAPDDVMFINALLDDLFARFTVDRRRIFVTGFSNGASLCFRLGGELSSRIAAIAPVAGSSWREPLRLERPIPVLYITGTADPLNPLQGGVPKLATSGSDQVRGKPKPPVREFIAQWTRALGCPATPRGITEANSVRTEIYGPGREGVEFVYITVEGLGHTWAGGESLLPEFMVGSQSDKIKATDVIWEFFQKHPQI